MCLRVCVCVRACVRACVYMHDVCVRLLAYACLWGGVNDVFSTENVFWSML
jgi:hypothetical protein